MMEIQRLLREHHGPHEELLESIGIRFRHHETLPLIILNYTMLANKHSKVIQECRGLVLETSTWNVVGRSFPRFFNLGECPDQEALFDWDSAIAYEKEDGSLVLLFWYQGRWHVTTRGSFASAEIAPGVGLTWEEAFFKSWINREKFSQLDKSLTYVFEFCSPWNRVVREYKEPKAFFLTAFNNKTGKELTLGLGVTSDALDVNTPRLFFGISPAYLQDWMVQKEGASFEGYVLRDKNDYRLKVKNPRYVALHRLLNNSNIFSDESLLKLALSRDQDEVLLHFPDLSQRFLEVWRKVDSLLRRVDIVWKHSCDIKDQKEFALFVKREFPDMCPLLFEARKHNVKPRAVIDPRPDFALKLFAKVLSS